VSRLPAWLLTVVRNRARDHWRRQVVEERYAGELPWNPRPVSRRSSGGLESPDLPVHRTCLMLRTYGMTRAEIATKTGSARCR
jgi:DNA-directed RNA polymerase specialized sigma24 family protein